MSDRQFRGIWIPVHIWETSELTAAERCLWAEIDSFTNSNSGYYKTNKQAGEELGISERQVSRAFAKLENMGLITVEKSGVRRLAKSTVWRDVHDCVASNTRQGGEVTSPERRGIKNKEKTQEKNNKITLWVPFHEPEFNEIWNTWVRERAAYAKGTYTIYAQQRALYKLDRLSASCLEVAVQIIDQSIRNAWKDFFPIREERHKRRPNLDADAALKWASE